MTKSRMEWNAAAPTSGPITVCMPPSRVMTRKSTDIGMEISVGSIEPLEKANRPPASPAAAPAMVKASQRCVRTSMPMASARTARIARRAQRVAEGRVDAAPQQHDRPRALTTSAR